VPAGKEVSAELVAAIFLAVATCCILLHRLLSWWSSEGALPFRSALRANDHWRAAHHVIRAETRKIFLFRRFARCAQSSFSRSAQNCRGLRDFEIQEIDLG
jgi:hypothetical protein